MLRRKGFWLLRLFFIDEMRWGGEKDILYTCGKGEYGTAACGGILPRQH